MKLKKEAIEVSESEDIAKNRAMVLEHRVAKNNAASFIAFDKAEQDIIADKGSVITSYLNETVTKILLKQLPLSAYDEMEAKCYEYGLQDVLDIYEAAYARIK